MTRRLLTLTLAVAASGVAVFHLALFGRRLADATILEPDVLVRWILSSVFLAGTVVVQRFIARGPSRRRGMFILGLLLLLLHVVPANVVIFMTVVTALLVGFTAYTTTIDEVCLRPASRSASFRTKTIAGLPLPRPPPAV